jgi:aspartate-alanine antiporter
MTCTVGFFNDVPISILFLTIGLGFLAGKLKVGPVGLGGVCGTLIVALILGQTGCQVSGVVKDVAFALFIFAMGYAGGPQFFSNLNRSSLRYMALPFMEAFLVLAIAVAAAMLLHLDAGTTAGLAAGAATESAVVGTAIGALESMGLPAAELQLMQANIATAYSLTYLVGLITIVLFTSQIAPLLLRIDLRAASKALEQDYGLGDDENTVAISALPRLVGRACRVEAAIGKTVAEVEVAIGGRTVITRLLRKGALVPHGPTAELEAGDIVVVLGRRSLAMQAVKVLGAEVAIPESQAHDLQLKSATVVLNRKQMNGKTLGQLPFMIEESVAHGVFIQSITRMNIPLPVFTNTVLRYGDLVTLVGIDPELSACAELMGLPPPEGSASDIVFLCLGVLAGLGIGSLSASVAGIPVSLGSGGGALVSGLVCGWINAKRPRLGHIPPGAVHLLKDLGLAIFVACVGLSAGPQALVLVREHGWSLPLVGIVISLVPACVSLWVGHKFLKIEGPLLIGAIAGQHVSTPTISAVLSRSGSSVPLLGYTVTYAVANVLLPVLGPIIVAVAHGIV